jgi:lipoate-protein ligase A
LAGHHPLAVKRLRTYQAVHAALIEALSRWGIRATTVAQPYAHRMPVAGRQPFLCFERRAPGDVLLGGVKIAGSAQRRSRGAVLQHGSLLLGRSAAAPELMGLKELTGKTILVEELLQVWSEMLAGALGVGWQGGGLPQRQFRQASRLAVEKYASPGWTEERGRG